MFSGLLLLHLVFAPCSGKLCFAETPEEKGRAIVLEAERRDQGFGDVVAEMEMILRNKNGQESRRKMTTKTLEVKNDGDKNLSLFHTPVIFAGQLC